MRESDLYPAVKAWLTSQGYTLHVEVFDHDIVASKGDYWIVVELKLCLTDGLIRQCANAAKWANEVWAAVASEPRRLGRMKAEGFGLLLVNAGKARKKLGARPQPLYWHKKRAYRLKKLIVRTPAMEHELAGLPSCRALRDQRRARDAAALQPKGNG